MINLPSAGRILLVEDDETTSEVLASVLVGAGFEAVPVRTLARLHDILRRQQFDAVLLDLRLPDGNALEAIADIRTGTSAGIVVATSSRSLRDRLAGLEGGADEFLEKPVHPRELVARIRNLIGRLRRNGTADTGGTLHRFEGWQVDLVARSVAFPDGREVRLTDGEFRILAHLIRHAGQPVDRERLLALLSNGDDVTPRAVDKVTYRLRLKLHEALGRNTPLIETVHGIGYRLIARRL